MRESSAGGRREPLTAAAEVRGGRDGGQAPGRASAHVCPGPTGFPRAATGSARDRALPASRLLTDR